MKNRIIKQALLSFAIFSILTGCGGDGKSGAASDSNLLSDDYIFIEPIPEPTPTPPEPTPPEPTPPTPTPDNTAPVADAGQNREGVNVGETIVLDGSGSYDADSDPLTYSWSIAEKPSGSHAALSNSSSINPSFVADIKGHYRVTLVVNDGKINSSMDSVLVAVEVPIPDNRPPTAVAKGTKTVIVKWGEKHEAILDGSESFDDGLVNPLTYSWQSGPYIVNQPIVRATPSCSDDWQRCYNDEQRPICSFGITLTVFDGEFYDTDTATLNVDYSECEHEPVVVPVSIHLDPAYTQVIPVTKHKTYKLWAYYDDSTAKDVTEDAVFSTSDPSIATIDANGKVTGVSKGDVLIIADYAGQRDTAPLTVTD
ncbi:PKD domain protein [hydrothermal vent metagenome]|uniref:PKD domain protein n=1 Tax=hydrothermal vent metagenome TaxID=652676 RepID=A0A1W1B8H3_9ZZZZ